MANLTCPVCGTEFPESNRHNKVFCSNACRHIASNARWRARAKGLPDPYPTEGRERFTPKDISSGEILPRTCEMCGKLIEKPKNHNQRFCSECRKVNDRMNHAQSQSQRRERKIFEEARAQHKKAYKRDKNGHLTLEECVRIADAAGLSYGQASVKGLFNI